MPKRNTNQKVNITPVHEKDYGTDPAEGVGEMGEGLGTPLSVPSHVGMCRPKG